MPILESDLNRETHPRGPVEVLVRLHAGLDHRGMHAFLDGPGPGGFNHLAIGEIRYMANITARSCLLTLFTCSSGYGCALLCVPYNTQACKPRTQPSCLQAWCVNLVEKRIQISAEDGQ
jgi:hypothetical protein